MVREHKGLPQLCWAFEGGVLGENAENPEMTLQKLKLEHNSH